MGRKVILASLLTLVLAALAIQPATAQGEVVIKVWRDGLTYTVRRGETPVLNAGWAACNRGLVNAWIKASNYAVTLVPKGGAEPVLTLTPEDVDQLWGPIEPNELEPPYEEVCVVGGQPSGAWWQYALTDLPRGRYTLYTTVSIDRRLIDGGDYDGDGKADEFRPEDIYAKTTNTIVVK